MSPTAWPSCPDCGSEAVTVLHEANPDASTTDATLECEDCERVFKDTVSKVTETTVDAVVSDDDESWPATVDVPPEERIRIGDELHGDGHRLLVTGLELDDGRRVKSATPDLLGTVWCKVFDTVTVKVAVNQGHKTWKGELTVKPEEPFFVGDIITLARNDVEIHAIKTDAGIQHRGSAEARDIKRLYAKGEGEEITYHEVHRTEIHRDRSASSSRSGTGRGSGDEG